MIIEYANAALERAKYEKIRDKKNPYYGSIPGLRGVWASGRTLEECRKRLLEVIDGWIVIRLKRGLRIPRIGKHHIQPPKELKFGT